MTTLQAPATAFETSTDTEPAWSYRRRRRHLMWADGEFERMRAAGGGEVPAICGVPIVVRPDAGPPMPTGSQKPDDCVTCWDISDSSAVIRL